MRNWARVSSDTICGGCGATIPAKAAVITITLKDVKRPLIRCETCVGLQAPPDLPEHVEQRSEITPMRKLAHEFGGKIWKRG